VAQDLRRIQLTAVALASIAAVTACGKKNSYAAVEDGLREWLAAIEDGDARACDLETNRFHRELLAENADYGGPGTNCAERVAVMADMDGDDTPPAADSAMNVPVWDPSGEALVEVTDARTGRPRDYWMVYRDGRWLVAGDEA
jgi:hypothetical protein